MKIRLKIIDRYLLKEFLGPFVLTVGGFAIIAIIDILFYLVELAINSGVSVPVVLKLLIYKLPEVLILFFPMAVIFAVMLLLVRLAKDNELTVLRSSGITMTRIIMPIIIMSLLASGLSYLTNEKIVPWTNQTSEKIIKHDVSKKPPPNIIENIVFKGTNNRFFYIKKLYSKEAKMEDIMIFEETPEFARLTTASEANWSEDSWSLIKGRIYEINENGKIDFINHFDKMKIHVIHNLKDYYSNRKSAREMDSTELRKRIEILDKGGISTRSLRVEYHLKKSIPIACVTFGILGIAFCLTFVRSGKDWWGVIVSIIIAVLSVGLYYVILAILRAMAKGGGIDPALSAWTPNAIYGFIGFSIIYYQLKYK